MIEEKIVNATSKDIEILTSMKLLTMIDDEMDQKLSYKDKEKIKNNIVLNIEQNYKQYKMIYLDYKLVGAYFLTDYLDGIMIDQFFLFEEYRNLGLGTKIIEKLKKKYKSLYVWAYNNNCNAIKLFKRLSFSISKETEKIIILKYDAINNGVMDIMKDINLGYLSHNGTKKMIVDTNFANDYSLQSPKEVLDNKFGLCFDQVELERELISKMDVDLRTYFLLYPDNDYAHAFLVYKDNDKYFWFEHAWMKYQGVHSYETKKDLFNDIIDKFVNTIDKGKNNKVKIYQYQKPRKGINYLKFKANALNGIMLK